MKNYFFGFSVIVIMGCSSHPLDPKIDIKPPKYVEQMPSKEIEESHNTGSLFSNDDNMFSDKKAMKINDVVTVVITEQVSSSSTGKAQTSESVSSSMSAVNMLAGGINHLAGVGLNPLASPLSSTRNFQGQGSNTREEKFSATVTARIIKVLQNGNYFIAGQREVLINGEKQLIRVAGVVRPSDIDSTNTIDSKYISDAKIEYKTEGEITRATDKNWFAKFLDAVSPF
jgi:flagellar L-ring protein precursor FlgH